MARILVVDDHPLFCEGLAHAVRRLRPAWDLHFAQTAFQTFACLGSTPFSLAVIDIVLPDLDGFSLLRSIGELHPQLPQILISGRSDSAVRVRAQNCGARGFMSKTMPPEKIVQSIDKVLSGGAAFDPGSDAGGTMPVLSPRQAEILELLSQGHGNKEIRHRLGIAERTVRAHITEVFHLLQAHSRTQALIRARQLGLIE